jgi:hypothetical protein
MPPRADRPKPPRPPQARAVQAELSDEECIVAWRDMQWWCVRIDPEHVAVCTFDVVNLTRAQADAVIAARGSFVDSLTEQPADV